MPSLEEIRAHAQLIIEQCDALSGETPEPPTLPPLPGQKPEPWTPVIGAAQGTSSQHYKYQTGYFTKVDRTIHWWAYVQFEQAMVLKGNIRLEGLPLPTASEPGFFGGGCSYSSNLTPAANDIAGIDVWTSGARVDWNLYGRRLGQNPRPLVGEDLNAATQLILHGSYFTD